MRRVAVTENAGHFKSGRVNERVLAAVEVESCHERTAGHPRSGLFERLNPGLFCVGGVTGQAQLLEFFAFVAAHFCFALNKFETGGFSAFAAFTLGSGREARAAAATHGRAQAPTHRLSPPPEDLAPAGLKALGFEADDAGPDFLPLSCFGLRFSLVLRT